MPSYNTRDIQGSEEVERLIRETELCKPCSLLFSEQIYRQHGSERCSHHESHTSLCQSLRSGCRLCSTLKETWDFEAAKQVSELQWHSVAYRYTEDLDMRIHCSEKLSYSKSYKELLLRCIILYNQTLLHDSLLVLILYQECG